MLSTRGRGGLASRICIKRLAFRLLVRKIGAPEKPMPNTIHLIERTIGRMSAIVRRDEAHEALRSLGEDPKADRLGWWVLACGEAFDPDDFEQREAARERLLDELQAKGVVLPEYIWVWDEQPRAQLVITSLPSEERAQRVAEHLRKKGLEIRVRREDF